MSFGASLLLSQWKVKGARQTLAQGTHRFVWRGRRRGGLLQVLTRSHVVLVASLGLGPADDLAGFDDEP